MKQNALNLSRKSDPITSHLAAARVSEFSSAHCKLICDALAECGPMTCDEIADHTGLLGHQVNKRVSDLQRKGEAEPTGELRLSGSGRKARVWRSL